MRAWHSILGVSSLLVLLTGCALMPGSRQADLSGAWQLDAGTSDGSSIPRVSGHVVTLVIDGSDVRGNAGCNIYSGTMTIRGGGVSFASMSMTEMGCEPDAMALESAYAAALSLVTDAKVDGDRLTLSGIGTELRFARQAAVVDAKLVGTRWLLDTLVSGETASSTLSTGTEAVLELRADGTLSGSTGCRTFDAHYAAGGGQLAISDLIIDDRACSGPVGTQDVLVLAVLDGASSVRIEGDRLTLSASTGNALGYAARR